MNITRIYTTPEGGSKFEDFVIPYDEETPLGKLSKMWPTKGIIFRETDGLNNFDALGLSIF